MTENQRSGAAYGIGAYMWWWLFPGFFSLLLPAGALEVLAHRYVWTALFLVVVLIVARGLGDIRRLTPRTWLLLTAASGLIGINWGTYMFALIWTALVVLTVDGLRRRTAKISGTVVDLHPSESSSR
jgi:chloramphenicol-sensitive protein RarD